MGEPKRPELGEEMSKWAYDTNEADTYMDYLEAKVVEQDQTIALLDRYCDDWQRRAEAAEAKLARAVEALRALRSFGVEMDDPRLDYVVVQVDRDDIAQADEILTAPQDPPQASRNVVDSAKVCPECDQLREDSLRAVMGWVVASVKDSGWCDIDEAIHKLFHPDTPQAGERETFEAEGALHILAASVWELYEAVQDGLSPLAEYQRRAVDTVNRYRAALEGD